MATTVLPSGGGFFDAASASFERGAQRGTDFYVQQQQLEQQQEALKLEEKKFTLTKEAEAFRQRQITDEIQGQREALKASLPDFQASGLLRGITPEAIDAMDPGAVISMSESLSRIQNLQTQTGLGRAQLSVFDRVTDSALAAEEARTRLTNMQADAIPEELNLARAANARAEAQFTADLQATNAQLGIQARSLAGELGLSPVDMNTQLFGTPTGNANLQDMADRRAWEQMSPEERPPLGEFLVNKKFERVTGVFGIGTGATSQLRDALKEQSPMEVFRETAMQETENEEQDMAKLAVLYSLKTLYPEIHFNVPAAANVSPDVFQRFRSFISEGISNLPQSSMPIMFRP